MIKFTANGTQKGEPGYLPECEVREAELVGRVDLPEPKGWIVLEWFANEWGTGDRVFATEHEAFRYSQRQDWPCRVYALKEKEPCAAKP